MDYTDEDSQNCFLSYLCFLIFNRKKKKQTSEKKNKTPKLTFSAFPPTHR